VGLHSFNPQDVTGYFDPHPLLIIIGEYLANELLSFVCTQQMSLSSWDEEEIMR
jgi:hypothetical protein